MSNFARRLNLYIELIVMKSTISDGIEYRYFEVDRASAHISTKRAISEDELLQPVTIVIKVIFLFFLHC